MNIDEAILETKKMINMCEESCKRCPESFAFKLQLQSFKNRLYQLENEAK